VAEFLKPCMEMMLMIIPYLVWGKSRREIRGNLVYQGGECGLKELVAGLYVGLPGFCGFHLCLYG